MRLRIAYRDNCFPISLLGSSVPTMIAADRREKVFGCGGARSVLFFSALGLSPLRVRCHLATRNRSFSAENFQMSPLICERQRSPLSLPRSVGIRSEYGRCDGIVGPRRARAEAVSFASHISAHSCLLGGSVRIVGSERMCRGSLCAKAAATAERTLDGSHDFDRKTCERF